MDDKKDPKQQDFEIAEQEEVAIPDPREGLEDKAKFLRDHFRVPTHEPHILTASLDGKEFDVLDIGVGGVCVLIKDEEEMPIGTEFDSISLSLEDYSLNLSGRVVHISPLPYNNSRCGIMFTNLESVNKNMLHDYVERIRSELFT